MEIVSEKEKRQSIAVMTANIRGRVLVVEI